MGASKLDREAARERSRQEAIERFRRAMENRGIYILSPAIHSGR
jgi:hypothetical protein